MRHSSVKRLLLVTIFVVAVVPLAAAFYFLNRALQTSLDLGFSEPVTQALDVSSQNLKTLKRLDPQGQERYRQQFAAVESLKRIYSNPQWVKAEILGSLRIYFGIGLVATVLLAVLLALVLSQPDRSFLQSDLRRVAASPATDPVPGRDGLLAGIGQDVGSRDQESADTH